VCFVILSVFAALIVSLVIAAFLCSVVSALLVASHWRSLDNSCNIVKQFTVLLYYVYKRLLDVLRLDVN